MKTTAILFMFFASFSYVLAAPFRFDMPSTAVRPDDEPMDDSPKTPFCRLSQGPSRCVDAPLPVEDKEPWCPYRMCGPSYVPAELCPANKELQATNKCVEDSITRDIYKCDNKYFGHNYVPIGCTPGTIGCNEVPTCSCFQVFGVTSKILKDVGVFTPDCPNQEAP